MEYGRSNRAPVLDEDDDDGDIPLPSHIVRDQINVSDLREATGNDSISDSRHSFHYPIPDISMQSPTRWVYEWEDPHFYTMLVQEWQTTSAWTDQTWQQYKAELLRVRGIALMSTTEYQTASQMGVFPFLR